MLGKNFTGWRCCTGHELGEQRLGVRHGQEFQCWRFCGDLREAAIPHVRTSAAQVLQEVPQRACSRIYNSRDTRASTPACRSPPAGTHVVSCVAVQRGLGRHSDRRDPADGQGTPHISLASEDLLLLELLFPVLGGLVFVCFCVLLLFCEEIDEVEIFTFAVFFFGILYVSLVLFFKYTK